jgi:hypothetical protein
VEQARLGVAAAMIVIHASCEAPGCSTAQAFAFEFAIETFAHLVEAMGEAGWLALVSDAIALEGGAALEPVGIQRRTHTYCPTHAFALRPCPANTVHPGESERTPPTP